MGVVCDKAGGGEGYRWVQGRKGVSVAWDMGRPVMAPHISYFMGVNLGLCTV